jgi:hypothetical protein
MGHVPNMSATFKHKSVIIVLLTSRASPNQFKDNITHTKTANIKNHISNMEPDKLQQTGNILEGLPKYPAN